MDQIAAMDIKKRYYVSTLQMLKAYAERTLDLDGQNKP